ncbi:hypothetical protein PGB28_09440 [Primorskyibacter aestuariivivens]|uniref:hypothetical protein n=1 Tax=Primorskyibacter aestuariivivens TaxID=1888912 RepID=UPI0022FFDC33|nr:hypothetical protein [Primorskyibacter aestuariivivens]MDA7428681.1 hypothetical protein [Primorskyibacter aestuariivivens]
MSVYRFEASARGPRAVLGLALWWAGLLAAYLIFDATLWILLPLALASLPALYELGKGARATLEIDSDEFRWSSGRRQGRMLRSEVDRVRLDTKLDMSLRMSLVTPEGRKIRLPYECVPPRKALEEELDTRGITVERHHFSLMG